MEIDVPSITGVGRGKAVGEQIKCALILELGNLVQGICVASF